MTDTASSKLRLWPFGLAFLALLGVVGGGVFHSARSGVLLERHPEAARKLARLLDHLGMSDGSTVHTNDRGRLEVRRVAGIPVGATWNGESLPMGRVHIKDGILTALSDDGRVLADLPLDEDSRASWEALSPHERLGLWLEQHDDGMAVLDVDSGSPAAEAGVFIGDIVTRFDGQPAVGMGLRAALIGHIVGGELQLTVRRGGESLDLGLELSVLMEAELLAGSHDMLGDYLRHAEAKAARRAQEHERQTGLLLARIPGELLERLASRLDDTTPDAATNNALRRAAEKAFEGLGRSTSISTSAEKVSYSVDFEPQEVRERLVQQLDRELRRQGIGADDIVASQLRAIVHAADDLALAHFESEVAAAHPR